MAIQKINIQNFTVFNNINIDFSDGINVFIGANGTGKTHLLKILYAFCQSDYTLTLAEGINNNTFGFKLLTNFWNNLKPYHFHIDNNKITVISDALTHEFELETYFKEIRHSHAPKKRLSSVFIPSKDMLTHSGIEKDYEDFALPFDKTLIDILNKTGGSKARELTQGMQSVLDLISELIDGKVIYEKGRYLVEKNSGIPVDFAMEAEGFKKLGLIYMLIETGRLKSKSVLLWDEPEANLNPGMIPLVVDIILGLSRNNVQVFISTHDYSLAKYIEIRQSESDKSLFHSLYKTSDGIAVESCSSFMGLQQNIIMSSLDKLMDEAITGNMVG